MNSYRPNIKTLNKNPSNPLSVWTALILVLFFALLVPFLNYARYAPLPDWWADALTITFVSITLLGFGILTFAVRDIDDIRRDMTLPLAGVVGVIWLLYVQWLPYLLGNQLLNSLDSLGVIFALAAGWLVYTISQRRSKQEIINILATLLLCGALLQACIGFAQAMGLAPLAHGFLMYDVAAPRTTIMGNLAQRNHFAHYLGWGLTSAAYLYGNRKLTAWLALPSIAIMALLMAWSASRLVLAYGCGLALFALYWRQRNRSDENLARFVSAVMWIVLAIALTQLLIAPITHFLQWLGLPLENLGSGVSRFVEADLGGRRRVEWAKSWHIFLQHPWFGVGLGGYSYQSVWLDTYGGYPAYVEGGLFTHSHNLVMQLLAETGLVGVLIIGFGIVWCATAFFRRGQQTCEHLFLASALMITLIHSMFEYPLWYLPFLTGFVIFLSLAPVRPWSLPMRLNGQALLAVTLGGMGLWYVVTGAPIIDRLIQSYNIETHSNAELAARQQEAKQLSQNPFWTYAADSLLMTYLPTTRTALTPDAAARLARLTAYRPYPVFLFKLSVARAYAGRYHEAEDLQLMMLAGHPLYTSAMYERIVALKDPALKPLQQRMAQAKIIYDKGGPEAVVRWVNTVQHQRGCTLLRD